jgi:hypothetical protein
MHALQLCPDVLGPKNVVSKSMQLMAKHGGGIWLAARPRAEMLWTVLPLLPINTDDAG